MTDKISMIELFSGVGAQERALRQLGLPYEVINTCDCDAAAVLSYAAMRWDLENEMETFEFPSQDKMIEELQAKNLGYDFQKDKHGITKRTPINKLKQYYIADKLSSNLGDISKVEKLPYADIVTYSFCCQDLSVAGKGEGMKLNCDKCGHSWLVDFEHPENNSSCPNCGNTNIASTRSGLLGQVQRLLGVAKENNTLPKYLLLENVKNLVGKKFKPQFDAWLKWLDSIGYNTSWKILNAKNFGVPQNRERIFAISIRKDIDTNSFIFPESIPLTTRLKDILEHNVDEKYYLPDERIEKILNSSFMQEKKRIQTTDVYDTLTAGCHGYAMGYIAEEQEPFIVASRGRNPDNPSDRTTGIKTEQRFEPNKEGICNCLTSIQKDSYVVEPQVLRAERTEYGKTIRKQYEAGEVDEKIGNMREMKPRTDGVSNTITTLLKDNYVAEPVIIDNIYNSREPRIYSDATPTLRSERTGLKVADEIEYPCSTRGKQVASAIRASIYKQGARNLEKNVVDGLGYEGIIEQKSEINPKFVGGIGEKNFGKQYRQGNRVYDSDEIAMALNAQPVGNAGGYSYLYAVKEEEPKIRWRIRKLTPLECWRLMNFTDQDCNRAAKYVSASALYKQAGNSIVVVCLIAIFSSLFIEDGYKSDVWTKYSLNYDD